MYSAYSFWLMTVEYDVSNVKKKQFEHSPNTCLFFLGQNIEYLCLVFLLINVILDRQPCL